MIFKDIINIVAIVVSPIVAVIVGQYLQKREKQRADKMELFKILMIDRGLAWSIDSVKALNVIEIVFSDDKKVLNQWRNYYKMLCNDSPSEEELSEIKDEGDKLLSVMAESLGYKDKISWDTIRKPYIPKGLTESINQQQQFKVDQLSVMNMMNTYMQQMHLKDKQ